MIYHPNFPPSLSITPTAGPKTRKYALGGVCRDAFGVEAQQEAISGYGIAGKVWETAYTLCAYIDSAKELDFDPPFADDPRVPLGIIELGSGTGVVAASVANVIRSAVLLVPGGFVIATDLPDVCPLLEHNLSKEVDLSQSDDASVFVRPLAWGNLDHAISIANEFGFRGDPAAAPWRRLTHIVCSDLASTFVRSNSPGRSSLCDLQVCFPELFGPLLRTLIHLTSPSCDGSSEPLAKIVISYEIRSLSKETSFWTAFGLWFSFHPVLVRRRVSTLESESGLLEVESDNLGSWRQIGADENTDRTFVFVAHRRPESITWQLPGTDQELMDGVGVRDTTAKKGDDTFEMMLFMAMVMDNTNE